MFVKNENNFPMKKIVLLMLSAAIIPPLFAQIEPVKEYHEISKDMPLRKRWGGKCGEMEFHLDSLYNYQYRSGSWNIYAKNIYTYTTAGLQDSVLFLDGNNQLNRISRYIYDEEGNTVAFIQRKKYNDQFVDYSRTEYSYQNNETVTTSKTYDFNTGEWNINSIIKQIYYNNTGVHDSTVSFKLMDGIWLRYKKLVYEYYDDGSLFRLYTIPYTGDLFFAEYVYTRDDRNLLTETYETTFKTDSLFAGIDTTKIAKSSYLYDMYSLPDTTYYSVFENGQWVLQRKSKYFWGDITKDKKVTICHHNHTLCVSVNSVKAHLRHGDYLGACVQSKGEKSFLLEEQPAAMDIRRDIQVFPNPAKDILYIRGANITRVELYDLCGKKLQRYVNRGENEIPLELPQLPRGIYLINIHTDSSTITEKIIITD